MPEVITDNLDLWTSALLTKSTAGRGSNGKLEAYGIKKLRELILELAVRGKLVPQDPSDEPASVLLDRIVKEKARLIEEGVIRKETALPEIPEAETPHKIPESWEWMRLTDLYYSISLSGKKLKTSEIVDKGQYPVVDQGQSYIAGFTDDPELLIEILGPVVIFGDHTTEIKYIDFNFVAGADGTKILRPYLMDERYFYTYLKSYKLVNRGYARHFKVLNANLMALPPLAEQHRIVAKVDELMALCDQLEQQQTHSIEAHQTLVETLLGTLTRVESPQEFSAAWARIASHFDILFSTEASIDQLKQTILQLAVMGKLVPQDPNDESAGVLLTRIARAREQLVIEGRAKKQKDLLKIDDQDIPFPLPENWVWTRFEHLINPEFPLSYGVLVPGSDVDGGVPFVRIEDLDIKNPPEKPAKSIAEDIDVKYERTRLMGGEILMGVVGSIGKLGIAPNSWKGANIARAVCRIMPTESVNKQFVVWLLQSEFMQGGFLGDTRTLAQPTLNIGLIRAALTPLPPLAEQHRIVAKVHELMAVCDALKARLADAQAIQLHLADAIFEQALV